MQHHCTCQFAAQALLQTTSGRASFSRFEASCVRAYLALAPLHVYTVSTYDTARSACAIDLDCCFSLFSLCFGNAD